MSEPCADCPCPTSCLRWPIWCEQMARRDDPDYDLHRRHIVARSAMGEVLEPAPPLPADYAERLPPLGGCCGGG